jgi:hypothetical protein
MIHLLWSVFNLLLLLSFYYFALGLIFKGRKFLESYPKVFVGLVLIFGTFGFLKSATKNSQEQQIMNSKPVKIDFVPVVDKLSNRIELTLIRDINTGEIDKESSTSSLHGFMSGLRWNHLQISESNGRLAVEGWWDWYLIGNRVFRNFEVYELSDKDLLAN